MNHDSSSAPAGSRVNGTAKALSASDAPRTLETVAVELRRKVLDLLELQTNDEVLQNLQKQVRISLEVIEESFKRYRYVQRLQQASQTMTNTWHHDRPDELSLSYNGGKDCLVLLVLILACLPSSTSTFSSFPEHLQSIFIIPYDSFTEVEDFVATSTREYFLQLSRYVLPMRPALDAYLAEKPNIKAIWIGTRRVDPNGGLLTHFDYTDKDWPQFMRIHPVIVSILSV
jgi:FAD synthetase